MDQVTVSRELLRQAFDYLNRAKDGEWDSDTVSGREMLDKLRTALDAPAVEPIYGDILPPIGSRVFIRHDRDDDAHACTVTGYYAWGDLGGDKYRSRVFVRLVYEVTNVPQARILCDCYPSTEAALNNTAATVQTDRQRGQ